MKTRIISYTLLLSSVCLVGLSLSAAPTSKGSRKMDKSATSAKIAIVDLSRIMTQDPQLLKEDGAVSHEWRDLVNTHLEAMKKIEEEYTKLQTNYQTKLKELEALQKSGVSTPEMLQKRFNEEAAPLGNQLQQQGQQIQQFQMAESRKIEATVIAKVQKATDEVVKAQGWDFAVNRNALLSTVSSGSRYNITDDVLSALNAVYSKEKAQAKPAAAKA